MEWYMTQSDTRPELVDDQSSNSTVYIRRNIEEAEVPSIEEGGEPTIQYKYEERKVPRSQYEIITAVTDNVSLKHDSQVIDDYTIELIEEGLL